MHRYITSVSDKMRFLTPPDDTVVVGDMAKLVVEMDALLTEV